MLSCRVRLPAELWSVAEHGQEQLDHKQHCVESVLPAMFLEQSPEDVQTSGAAASHVRVGSKVDLPMPNLRMSGTCHSFYHLHTSLSRFHSILGDIDWIWTKIE